MRKSKKKQDKRKWMTLAEHEARLKAEGRYDEMVERHRKQEETRQESWDRWARAEKPLVEELRAAGFAVDSAWDLVNTATPYPAALPILLEHLQRPYPGRVREGTARALAVPEAKFAWNTLVDLYKRTQCKSTREGLAVAIDVIADESVIDEVIDLARDRRLGGSRVMLLDTLAQSNSPRARATLMALGTDPDVYKQAQICLRRAQKRAKR